ncbi:MAG: bacillithiol biosynthesis cysteine-adding enzyme BshC, partial [Archangium sp.]
QPGSVAVVTGQQVGLFLGPLYSFYKAASAVISARALELETGVRCVPVFWLQTEDHDVEEIDHLDVGEERIRLQSPHVPRASISELMLGDGVGAALSSLGDALEGAPHVDDVIALFERHYRRECSWASAFAGVMSELLPSLVILDPRDEAMARFVGPIHERAFAECDAIAKAMLARQEALQAAGFDVQVHVREDSPLSFVHPDGRDGPRFRVERCAEGWKCIGGEQVVSELDALRVSTSALLRPIVQDTLLPTAAIIGGPGELNYFAQVSPLYAHYGMAMPMVMPRARFRVLEPRVVTLLSKLGLQPHELEHPRDAVLQKLAPVGTELTPEVLERRLLDAIEPVLASVPGVEDAVKRTRGTMARAASRLAGRYAHSLRTHDETVIDRVDRIQRSLFPHGEPQERVLGFPEFAAKFGIDAFRQMVLGALVPFSYDVVTLR